MREGGKRSSRIKTIDRQRERERDKIERKREREMGWDVTVVV